MKPVPSRLWIDRTPPRLAALCRQLGSLKVAVFLISLYAVIIALATFWESRYGAAAVQFGVYSTSWFAGLNLLLAWNVLFAAVIRLPWRKSQIGFVLTHVGILVLLAGAWLTLSEGIEAQLPVFEGETASRAVQDSRHFELTVRGKDTAPPTKAEKLAHESGANDPNAIRMRTELHTISFVPGPFSWSEYENPWMWFPWRLARRTQGVLFDKNGVRLEIVAYIAPTLPMSLPQTKIRLTVEGRTEEFWLTPFVGDTAAKDREMSDRAKDGMNDKQQDIIEMEEKGRKIRLILADDAIEFGFAVHLKEFQRKLDPGSGMPSHYASLIDVKDRLPPEKTILENALVTLNSPVEVTDPHSGKTWRLFQSSFNGPWGPGDPVYEKHVDPQRSRDQLFISFLNVNYDPGRSLKYVGSGLIVLGIILIYVLRLASSQPLSKKTA